MDAFLHQNTDTLRHCLEDVDAFAKENVARERGGPFSARLVLFTMERSGTLIPQIQFPISCNMVLETGVGSFHAEAQALNAGHIAILKQKIHHLSFDTQSTPLVVLFSSAQPCMACQTKIEICARQLVHANLIQPKNFLLVYGANYEETEKIAGLHDYAYALDFFNFGNSENTHYSLISHEEMAHDDVPREIHDVLINNALIEAILVRDGHIISLGYDQRTDNDYFKTSECVALHAASRALKNDGSETPWKLDGAELYSLNPQIGPLSYAECQWAAVKKIVTIMSPHPPHTPAPKHLDCPNCSNMMLFQKIAEGYNTPWSTLTVAQDSLFENKGQREWASRMTRRYYNGHEAGSVLTLQEKQIFDNLFVPHVLI